MVRQKLIDCRGKRTLLDVASDLDISRQMLGAIESGERNPSFYLMKRIADYYGMKVDALFFDQVGNSSCL